VVEVQSELLLGQHKTGNELVVLEVVEIISGAAAGGSGTANQGFAGGKWNGGNPNSNGGGGGGAGEVGNLVVMVG
jgi:hypothetical protein